MNYLKQINGFWNWRKMNTLTHAQADLYFSILDCANASQWKESFRVPNSTLMNLCQCSKTQLFNTRNRLAELGLIAYSAGKKGLAGTYSVVPLYSDPANGISSKKGPDLKPGPGPDFKTNPGTIIKERIKENINNNLKKNYRKNVLLSDNEYRELEKKYGEYTAGEILDKLSEYKEESGKNYADDFAAINRWVADAVLKAPKSGLGAERGFEVYKDCYDHDELEKLTCR